MGHQSAGLRSKQVLTEELAEIERRFASADGLRTLESRA